MVTMRNAPVGQDDIRGTDLASQDFAKQRKHDRAGKAASVRGVGDEAYGRFSDHDGHAVIRDGNVTVTLNYTAPAPRGPNPAAQRAMRTQLVNAAKEVAGNLEK